MGWSSVSHPVLRGQDVASWDRMGQAGVPAARCLHEPPSCPTEPAAAAPATWALPLLPAAPIVSSSLSGPLEHHFRVFATRLCSPSLLRSSTLHPSLLYMFTHVRYHAFVLFILPLNSVLARSGPALF